MSKNFNLHKACVLPFSHFNAYPDGKARACTMSQIIDDIDLNKISIDSAFNSDQYKKLRHDMLNGVENDICKVCYNMEDRNSKSYRQSANENYESDGIKLEDLLHNIKEDGEILPNYVTLDIRPSNICNFKCRTCAPDFSTRWIEEDKAYNTEMGIGYDETKYKAVEKEYGISDSSIVNLKQIYIAGGESLYMTEMYKFLENIKNKSQIVLHVHTNFSILKFKHYDIFKLLQNFNKVHFFISCDGIDEVGEYVRTGFNWEVFCKNLESLLEKEIEFTNFSHSFHFTSSILNVFHFFEFLEEMKNRKYIKNDSQVDFHIVRWPTYFNSINFNMKTEILEYYIGNINTIESDSLRTQIQNYIDYVKDVNMEQDWMTDGNEGGIDFDAIERLKSKLQFGNKFNNTQIPAKLNYLKKYLID